LNTELLLDRGHRPGFHFLAAAGIGRIARRPLSVTQMWPPFAGSKVAPRRSSHRLNSALVTW